MINSYDIDILDVDLHTDIKVEEQTEIQKIKANIQTSDEYSHIVVSEMSENMFDFRSNHNNNHNLSQE